MEKNDDIQNIIESHKTYFVASLISTLYLIIWIFLQWGVSWTLTNLPLEGIDKWMLFAFQILFSISTLAPIMINLFIDVRVMVIRGLRKIKSEENKEANFEVKLDLNGEFDSEKRNIRNEE